MKKKIVAIALVAGIGLVGLTQAYAGWGTRGGGNWNCPRYGSGPQYMQPNVQLDAATREKLDAFYNDTAALRKEIAVKQAERMALVRSANPDGAALGKITGELFDLRNTLQLKAEEAGVPAIGPMMGGPGMGRGFGPGMRGPGMRGPGMGRGFGPGNGGPGSGWGGRGMGYMMNAPAAVQPAN